MRRLIPVVLVLAGCAVNPTSASFTRSGAPTTTNMVSVYDLIEGESQVTSPVFRRSSTFGPTVALALQIVHPDSVMVKPPDHIWFTFNSTSGTGDGWRFLESHDFNLLLDGSERMAIEGSHDGDVGTILLHERITIPVPLADFERIAGANAISGKVGYWTFVLTPEEISAVRQIYLFATMDPTGPMPIRHARR